MVQKIRTSLVVSLTVINLISILAIFMFLNFNKGDINYNENFYIKQNNYERTNRYNTTNSIKYNNNYEIYGNKYYFIDYYTYYHSVVILNSLCIFFWIYLICTFCVGESDCTCDGGACCDSSCNCGNCSVTNPDAGKLALLCLIFICAILAIYYSLKCIGKHIARYISLTATGFMNLFILILSILILDNENSQIYQIILFSGISTIANLSSVILPNLQSCQRLRFRSRVPPPQVINYSINQNSVPQINNNVMMNNNNMQNYNYNYNNVPIQPIQPIQQMQQMQANYIAYPNNYNPNMGPVVNYESKPNMEKNININSSNESNNQFVLDNPYDMGDAPLPDNENQVKK